MNRQALLAAAPERIREHRTAEVELRLVDERGQRLPNVEARLQLVRHEFRFGCNAFLLSAEIEDALLRAYEERFAALLNYATLPFYWGGYEQTPGVTGHDRLQRMAEWCARHGIAAKGHPLVWHEVFPAWGSNDSDDELLARLEARIHEIVSGFRGRIDIWDVVNEATVSHRFDNAIGRWIADQGAAACVEQALRWAREANPTATLLYNDFNVSSDMETLIAELLDRGAPLDAIGIQSHMHKGTWPLERAWQVCERFARFGLPLHWTELTVLSGRLKAENDNDWHARREGWESTPGGEQSQAEYGEALYTLLFSHPAVEAVTWWDFADYQSWQSAPSGLVRADMTPKPLYERLLERVQDTWSTDVRVTSDERGQARVRCTFGGYQVEATSASGTLLVGSFDFSRAGGRTVEVVLRPK